MWDTSGFHRLLAAVHYRHKYIQLRYHDDSLLDSLSDQLVGLLQLSSQSCHILLSEIHETVRQIFDMPFTNDVTSSHDKLIVGVVTLENKYPEEDGYD